jgi:hypothetical protein
MWRRLLAARRLLRPLGCGMGLVVPICMFGILLAIVARHL